MDVSITSSLVEFDWGISFQNSGWSKKKQRLESEQFVQIFNLWKCFSEKKVMDAYDTKLIQQIKRLKIQVR